MAELASQKKNIMPELGIPGPHTSTSMSSHQPRELYHNPSENNSTLSFLDSAPTIADSEVDLLGEESVRGDVELGLTTASTTGPSHQQIPESRPETSRQVPPLREPHLQMLDSLLVPNNDDLNVHEPNVYEPNAHESNVQPNVHEPNAHELYIQPNVQPNAHEPNVQEPNAGTTSREWKSWKIKYLWLSFLLMITISLIGTIITLNLISKKNGGFAPLTSSPGFLARDPEIERAIWAQGILYTSFPALIMTLYRTMWESTVAAFADRQPYVDLKKDRGRPAKATIMLDYKTEPALWAYILAFKNRHYILGLCMVSSVLLALLVVPLVAFLFTTDSFASNTVLPVSIVTSFDPKSVVSYPPDLRLSLNSAAAMRLQDGRGPSWTDGEFAFPKFLPSIKVGDGNATIETIAYSAHIDCEYMPESDYEKIVLPPGTPGYPPRVTTFQVAANDRGCAITGTISVTTVPEFPDLPDIPGMPGLNPPQNILKTWPTFTCSADSGWSRLSILTTRYVNSSTGITNFSLISCIPSYRMTPGNLVATTSASSEPLPKSFTPHRSNMTEIRPEGLWMYFELNMPAFNCFDMLRNIDADEFMRNVYTLAAKQLPISPLLPGAIIDAALTLWSTTFAVLASTELFIPTSAPLNGTGIYSEEVSRLIVVSPIAYIILSVLTIVALLNISLFFYASQKSILLEEPVGLVSAAGILRQSEVNEIVDKLFGKPKFNGKVTAAMKREDGFVEDRYRFDDQQKKIYRIRGEGTPPKSRWKRLGEWARESIISNPLMDRIRRL